jgi:hypothetical protein
MGTADDNSTFTMSFMRDVCEQYYEQIEGIRRQSAAVLEALIAKAGESEMAEPPECLEDYRRNLRENAHKVLVVG